MVEDGRDGHLDMKICMRAGYINCFDFVKESCVGFTCGLGSSSEYSC